MQYSLSRRLVPTPHPLTLLKSRHRWPKGQGAGVGAGWPSTQTAIPASHILV